MKLNNDISVDFSFFFYPLGNIIIDMFESTCLYSIWKYSRLSMF